MSDQNQNENMSDYFNQLNNNEVDNKKQKSTLLTNIKKLSKLEKDKSNLENKILSLDKKFLKDKTNLENKYLKNKEVLEIKLKKLNDLENELNLINNKLDELLK